METKYTSPSKLVFVDPDKHLDAFTRIYQQHEQPGESSLDAHHQVNMLFGYLNPLEQQVVTLRMELVSYSDIARMIPSIRDNRHASRVYHYAIHKMQRGPASRITQSKPPKPRKVRVEVPARYRPRLGKRYTGRYRAYLMARAVELKSSGLSNAKIASELKVSEFLVMELLIASKRSRLANPQPHPQRGIISSNACD